MKNFNLAIAILITALATITLSSSIHSMEAELSPALSTPKAENVLRVMSYNIRRKGKEAQEERLWEHRLPLVKELIERIKPDIIGLQEATKEQIADLKGELPQYSSFGEGRGESWWGWGTDEHTPIFYDTEQLDALDHGTFFINERESWRPWDARTTGWLPRICTWGKFKDKRTGKEFYLYNTHLDHMYKQAQLAGLERIKEKMPKDTHAPVILMGDFNTEFTDEIQDVLAGFRHTKDLATQTVGPQETRTGWDNEELKTIDHILVTDHDKITVEQYEVIEKEEGEPYPSDHRPVIADILLRDN